MSKEYYVVEDNLGCRYIVTHIEGGRVFLPNGHQIDQRVKEDGKFMLMGKLTFEELNL